MLRSKKRMNFIQKIWLLMKPFHRDFYSIVAITVVFQVVRMIAPYLFGKILDLLISTKGLLTFKAAALVVGGLIGIRVLSLVIDYLIDIVLVRLLWKSEQYVSRQTFNKLLQLSLDYHERENTGNKINIVNKGRDKLIDLLATYGWSFQPVVIQLVVSAILMIFVNWIFGLVFAVSLIPFIINMFKTYQNTQKFRTQRHNAYEASSGEIGDTLTNITVVKAFAQEEREAKAFSSIWDSIKAFSIKEFKLHMINGFLRSLSIEFMYAVLLIIGIYEIRLGLLTVGSLVFLISLTERAYSNIFQLGWIYERAIDASEPVDRVISLLSQKPTIINNPNAIVTNIIGQISFKHVTFAYNRKKVLKNIGFTVPAGSFTALVGKSGSGKTTIAKLLSRYYDPQSGSIIIDGKYDLKDLDLDTYRSQTSVVFQDSPVQNRKVWEIISYGAGKADFAEVKEWVVQAARLANAEEFIAELPDGYQTQIGERGVKLSGGQRQRLAIARSLFTQPKILIMDEPTSHLDIHSESLIQQALKSLSNERSFTKVIIAHRLSTVKNADQILVMEKGRIVERGTHPQLLSKNGVYAKIVAQNELKG
ncbi:ABC transporter ATP-binding protein [Candidatus Daviesbacteria bacterium]|nr:ABC transporter ATP-binding protein [Candidatus Daviesbacteria bacterium]